MLGFCVVSCKENPNKDDKAKAESEQVEEKVDLADIVAKAKAESANWTAAVLARRIRTHGETDGRIGFYM